MLAHALLPIAAAVGLAVAQAPQPTRDFSVPRPAPTPNRDPHDTNNLRLVGKRFEFDELPYKVDTAETARGIQVGFNQCNETTQSQTSMCQTIVVNSIEDFCIYIPPTMMPVGNAEAGMVAACTKPTHGARLIPAGALTAVQFIRTPSYVAVTGRINQQLLNIPAGDQGGEVDSGGQDLRGNPIGAMAYSEVLPYSEGRIAQSIVWHQFIGSDMFCMKLCDGSAPNAMGLCEHIYDTYGCAVNVPADYTPNVFLSCDGDDQRPVQPGVTDIPASSNCVTHTSAAIYTGLPQPSGGVPGATTTPGATGGPASSGGAVRPTGTTTRGGSETDAASTQPGDSAAKVSVFSLAAFIPVIAGLLGAAYVA